MPVTRRSHHAKDRVAHVTIGIVRPAPCRCPRPCRHSIVRRRHFCDREAAGPARSVADEANHDPAVPQIRPDLGAGPQCRAGGQLSPLTGDRLRELVDRAFHARIVEPDRALLIAFDQDADYDSPNFIWIRARYERFVYVDRIAVAPSARGAGLARALYEDLFQAARMAGHSDIVCEVNSDPPNQASDAFHARLGFAEVGRAGLANGKQVRYFRAAIRSGRASSPHATP